MYDCNFHTRARVKFGFTCAKVYRNLFTVWQELHSKNPSIVKDYQHEAIQMEKPFYKNRWKTSVLLVMI